MDAPESSPPLPDFPAAPRASTVIVHRVAEAKVGRFLEQQEEVRRLMAEAPGYLRTDLYPPTEPHGAEWVVVLHFDAPESLRRWMESPTRAEWLKKVKAEGADYRLSTLPTGFGAWLAGQTAGGAAAPPGWKTVLTVLLALYPTVMLLTIYLGPHTHPLGLAVSILIGNLVSVVLLQWVVMPPLSKALGWWLRANGPADGRRSLWGLALTLTLLLGMALCFQAWTG